MNIFKMFMPMSGNLGDTLNVMPVLSGIYKSLNVKIHLVVKDSMKKFKGLKAFLEAQDCIIKMDFESDVCVDNTFYSISLVDSFYEHPIRPWETVRMEEFLKRNYNLNFEVDDDFVFNVEKSKIFISDKYIVGDRMYHPQMDHRRSFNILRSSKQFTEENCYFLDFDLPIMDVASIIKNTNKKFITTFTGVAIVGDLLNKDMIIFWNDELKGWGSNPIEYSYNKHFYRNRKSELKKII